MKEPRTLSGDATLHLPEFDSPPADPLALLRQWIGDAEDRNVREPHAAALATAAADGRVALRTVLLKGIGDDGPELSFTARSRKGAHLAANPHAALNLYWRETLQQITVEGVVRALPDAVSDAIWEDRPRGARATSSHSYQSAELTEESALSTAARELEESAAPIPRPEHWHAFVLVPERIEFWHGSPDRLHRRLEYSRTESGAAWTTHRLQP
ncbi:pyridoxal 5'-phosphate synthase [Brevibacterium sp. CS2]|uniref:pyridoxal 5'-phosphate synthase n=1 Tax=Brevibacterium sp. CS2 TaxID=2575923 RepID=UPI0010C7DC61|nr:pyridoxal 5'-phosphate synthase [Brevibacterium sp. CS2]QCP05540.1 pyridoxamine 5'-phosphate oxidase [Brevibacterium sp. CS2]